MAVTGFKCESGADIFHAQQDMSRWLGAKIGRRAARAEKQRQAAQTAESTVSKTATMQKIIGLKTTRITAEKELEEAKKYKQIITKTYKGLRMKFILFHSMIVVETMRNRLRSC
ncbi:MAG: hypothetical protein Q9M50_10575 [Methylococcales bacterium]|nr:hypothetical protein [Methylococcales bacterium]MDQ7090085.1 hypothetical protein [Methylococcales bacterium]MDQ7090115.1 hypothetical protein [Methylococcales bacterium]MDQ7091070.1 hypothetical protein [Methylococcales bacterium]